VKGSNLYQVPELPATVEVLVAPGGQLSLGVNAFDNFWWSTKTVTVNGKEITYTTRGKLTVTSKASGLTFLEKEFFFGPKTSAEADEELAEINGSFPSKIVRENETLVTAYSNRPHQEWTGVAPVSEGKYTLVWQAEDTTGNIQTLSYDFEVRPVLAERYLLQNRKGN
jgi:hypothetical protein